MPSLSFGNGERRNLFIFDSYFLHIKMMYRLVKICDPGKNFVFVRHSNMPLPSLDSEGIVVFASRMPSGFKFQTMSLYRCGRTHRAADSHRKRQRRPKTSGQCCPTVYCMYTAQFTVVKFIVLEWGIYSTVVDSGIKGFHTGLQAYIA
jgi:hypothetical protein